MVIITLILFIIAIAITPSNSNFEKNVISSMLYTRLASIAFLFSAALAFNSLYIQSIGSGLSLYSGMFHTTVLSQSFDVFIYILASLILIPWGIRKTVTSTLISNTSVLNTPLSYTGQMGPSISEYSLILLFSALGSSLLLSSSNLLSMYLSLELQSFGVYILATIYRNSESSTSAGLKYFLLGGLSSCLILLGCVLIYSYTGLISFEDIYSLLTSWSSLNGDTNGVQLGFILILIGLLFKIASAPFHNWAPDVYSDVPTIVTTWLTVMPKIAIIIVMFEILSSISGYALSPSLALSTSTPINSLLLICSFLSLVIGTIVGLAQVKIKRLLAYSTISHVGFLLMALSINYSEESLESLVFYLIQYSLTNLNTFFILLSFGYIIYSNVSAAPQQKDINTNKTDINFISELKGQFWSNPLLSLSLSVCLFSMAGIPPLVGFFGKAQILYAATQNGYYFISIIAILTSVISAYYYLQIIRVMHFDAPSSGQYNKSNIPMFSSNITKVTDTLVNGATKGSIEIIEISSVQSYIISALTLSLLLFLLNPSILLNSVHLIALNIFIN